jgi:RNA polymerase sigma-70 factor (ECF subfamily)
VWIVVHRRLRRLAAPGAFRVWLYRIAHDQAVSELRRRSRQPVLLEDVEQSRSEDEAEPGEEAFDNAELVHAGLRDLSVDHRRVLTLKFLEDMSVDEIAEVLQCQPGTVKSRLYYARLALRDRIRELLDE